MLRTLVMFIASLFITSSAYPSLFPTGVIVLTPDNHVTLTGEVDTRSVSVFLQNFLSLKNSRRIVYISSPGGSVMDGMHLITVVRDAKDADPTMRVSCYVDEAASMAFAIVQGICDERHGGLTSTMMQHQASYGVQGSDNQIASRLKMISSVLKILDGLQAMRIGITPEELRRRSADEWWTVGMEAVNSKVLDRLTAITCTPALTASTRVEKFNGMFGAFKVVFSNCPLIQAPLEIIMDDKKPVDNNIRKLFERIPLSERVIRYK